MDGWGECTVGGKEAVGEVEEGSGLGWADGWECTYLPPRTQHTDTHTYTRTRPHTHKQERT